MQKSTYTKLWNYLSKRRQVQFVGISILMVIASLTEVLSLGMVVPFLAILVDPAKVFEYLFLQPIIQYFDIITPNQLTLPITVIFIIAAMFAGIVRLTLLYSMTRLSHATGADLSISIYRRTLYQEYEIHISRNSSELINGIITKTNMVIHGIINPILVFISSIILLTGILTVLLSINFNVSLSAFVVFGMLYWVVILFTKSKIKENSQIISQKSNQMVQSLQEGLGGIRDVIIDGSQDFYCEIYRSADLPLRRATGTNQFIGGSPRFAMEAIGITLIAIFAYRMTLQNEGIASSIPLLGALALGAQRLMPALQQLYSSYSSIKGAESSFLDVLALLDQTILESDAGLVLEPLHFNNDIKLKKLSFKYVRNSPWVLKDIDLLITKGQRIGFIGATGNGKSTLLDIMMGLLSPTTGSLEIDSQQCTTQNRRSWQKHVAHVPQNIYLSDSSIEENIAFGIPKDQIDLKQVEKAAEQAQILDLISGWEHGFKTLVGERGIRLSGGQRQRIGIARALYKNADVLIFDEATSALDNNTEELIMNSIENLNRDITVLIIAHRLTTLKNCDVIYELKNGSISVSSMPEENNYDI